MHPTTWQGAGIKHYDKIMYKTKSVTPIVVTQVQKFDGPGRASSLTSSHGAAELQYKTVHPCPWDVWLAQITIQNCCKEHMLKSEKDFNSTPPRETSATESQVLVAKWMVQ